MRIKVISGIAISLVIQASVISAGETASDTVKSFEQLFGITTGKRRNHTKGFCFTATLNPVGNEIQQFSNSPLFADPSPVIGRLSHKGGNNQAPDHKPAEYGMGLAITTGAGSQHLMSMNTLDFFPVSTPQAFADLMRAKVQGGDALRRLSKQTPTCSALRRIIRKEIKHSGLMKAVPIIVSTAFT